MPTPNRSALWLAGAVLLMALHTVAAQGEVQASFISTRAEWASSEGPATGELTGLVNRLADAPSSAPTDSSFQIQATKVEVAWDRSDLFLTAPGVAKFPGADGATIHRGSTTYTDATIQGTASRTDRFLYVIPLNSSVQASAPCGAATASPANSMAAPSLMNTRQDLRVDLSQALEVVACPDSNVVLQGDFLVVLWEWDCHVDAAEGSAAWWSGKAQPDAAPGAPDLQPYASKAQELYLTVSNGTFVMAGNAERPPLLYVPAVHFAGAATVTLSDANGSLNVPEAIKLNGHSVKLAGDLHLDLKRQLEAVALDGAGIESAEVDGRSIQLGAVVTPGTRGWTWVLVAVGTVAVPTLVVPVVLRSRRLRPRRIEAATDHAENELALLRHARAHSWTAKLVDWQPYDAQANYLHGKALAGLRRLRDALAHFQIAAQNLRARDVRLAIDLACDAVCVIAALQREASPAESGALFAEGLALVRKAAAVHPSFLREAETQPLLRPFLDALESGAGYA